MGFVKKKPNKPLWSVSVLFNRNLGLSIFNHRFMIHLRNTDWLFEFHESVFLL